MRRSTTFACIAFAALGSLPAAADWRALGLIALHVNRLAVHQGFLYACTDGGLWAYPLTLQNASWAVVDFAPFLDLVGLDPTTVLAAKQLTGDPADTVSLFLGVGYGSMISFRPFQNGFGAGGSPDDRQARRLLALGDPAGTILATSGRIEKSTDNGASWRVVEEPGAVINAIEQSPADPALIWAGGETYGFSPYVLKSSDAGETWTEFSVPTGGDNAVDAIAPHPADTSQVYLGMEGR
jgi:hypothetical protein